MADTITASNWRAQTPLPVANSNASLVSHVNHLVYVEGLGTNRIIGARLDPDGTIGDWMVMATIPSVLSADLQVTPVAPTFPYAAAIGNSDLVIGCALQGSSHSDSIFFTGHFTPGGEITHFQQAGAPIDHDTASFVPVQSPDSKSIFAFQLRTGTGTAKVMSCKDVDGLGWRVLDVNQPDGGVLYPNFAEYGGYVYRIGGSTSGVAGGVIDKVYSARMGVDGDGDLGPWQLVGNLPIAMWKAAMVVYKDKLILLGGQNAASANLDTMYVSRLERGGQLGAFVSDPARIPVACRVPSAAVVGHHLVLVGGFTTGAITNTYVCDLR